MLRELTQSQFLQLCEFASVYPMGEKRADLRAATVALKNAQLHVKEDDAKRLKLDDFLLKFERHRNRSRKSLDREAIRARDIAIAGFERNNALLRLRHGEPG